MKRSGEEKGLAEETEGKPSGPPPRPAAVYTQGREDQVKGVGQEQQASR
jgi:hypothetical protein